MTSASLTVLVQREGIWSYDGRVLLDEMAAMQALYSGASAKSRFSQSEISSARGRFLIARTVKGEAIGCGAYRRLDFGVAELVCIYSRMPNAGIGRAVLAGLESNASKAGYHTLMVEMSRTNRSGKRFFWRTGFEPAISACADLDPEQRLFLGKNVV
ncbi:GNAT family N-acetyltransferase [Caballeronia novacaledonica]|uniref:GNAT family N-acetyltransferase n=1 Tax=Caballeronia novacaledonica TaxID=1544861 RepID=A0AA37IGE3_9BURK|nr:GNAT family N-acetyltransferase [Caballeronia novacaledonica]GJH29275.1 GNAT family N-acetyltransferase [Caballeronia novacaledonica]